MSWASGEVPIRCVIDTNVAVTANGRHPDAKASCVAASAKALQAVMNDGHLFIDDGRRILAEYRNNLRASGQPGAGDAFFKWLLTNEWSNRVTRVPLTPKANDEQDFDEVPPPPLERAYDPSDRKFLAVAAKHPDKPPILQATDSKWWGWTAALDQAGVRVRFLCPEIEAKHRAKMGV